MPHGGFRMPRAVFGHRVRLAAIFLLPWITVGAAGESPRLTVAAYNVEFLLDVFDDPYSSDEDRPPKTRQATEAIAQAVAALDADVVAFVEVENEGTLRALVAELLSERGYAYVAVNPTNSVHGQNLGVISRVPIVSVTSHRFTKLDLPGRERTWRFARDLARFRLKIGADRHLDLYVAHFKSKRHHGDDRHSRDWRLAEARAVRRIIGARLEAAPEAWVLLAGDLNDTPGSPPLRLLTGSDERRFLTDVHRKLDDARRVTYLRKPYRGTVDYLLASPALSRRLVRGSARVPQDPRLLAGSDHAPVVATFTLDE